MQQDTQLRNVTEGSPWGDTRMGAESRSPRALEPWTASTRYPTQKQLLRVRAERTASQDRYPGAPVMRCSGEPRLTGPEPWTGATSATQPRAVAQSQSGAHSFTGQMPRCSRQPLHALAQGSRIRRSGTGAVLGN